jgi:hypothetical protein
MFFMAAFFNKTLLALSLALKDLEAPLSENEQKAFRDAAAQLQLDPDNWEDYEPDLLKVIQANPNLNHLYQATQSQLDALSSEISSNLLPTPAELEQAQPSNQKPVTRGVPPVNDDHESHEIQNMVIDLMASSNPVETAKKLSYLERVQQFIQQRFSGK